MSLKSNQNVKKSLKPLGEYTYIYISKIGPLQKDNMIVYPFDSQHRV